MDNKKEKLVLLCGLLCKDVIWEEVVNYLNDIFDIKIISFEGYTSIEDMAIKVIENCSEEVTLIGHSMGGRVALEVFKQEPKKVKRIGLFNTGVHSTTESEIPARQRLLGLANKEGIASVLKQWLPPMMGQTALENKYLIKKLEDMVLSYSVKEFSGQIHALINRPNAQSLLSQINIPTLLLSASEDNWSPLSQHAQMQKYIKNSQLVEIKDAGHMVPIEEPELISKIIREWINKKGSINGF